MQVNCFSCCSSVVNVYILLSATEYAVNYHATTRLIPYAVLCLKRCLGFDNGSIRKLLGTIDICSDRSESQVGKNCILLS